MKNQINEARRYIENAKNILKEKTKIIDGFYEDKKFVKMAGNTAYNGVLVALDYLAKIKNKKPKNRASKEFYEDLLAENKKIQKLYTELYQVLHLSCGYDGASGVEIFKLGIKYATELIDWVEIRTK